MHALIAIAALALGAPSNPGPANRVYGLRHVIDVADAPFMVMQPEQWIAPYIGTDAGLVYAGNDEGELRAVWVGTGKTLWKRTGLGALGRAMAQHQDTLLVGSGTNLLGLEGFSGKEEWRVALGGLVGGEITLSGPMAVVPVRPNSFVAIDLEKHEILWREKRPTPEGITVRGQPGAALDRQHERVLLGFSDGQLVAVHSRTGQQVWAARLAKPTRPFGDVDTKPLLLGDRVLAASYNGGLALLEIESGRVIWKNEELLQVSALLDIPDSALVVASVASGEVVGLTRDSGKIRWRYSLRGGWPTAPAWLGQGQVVVGTSKGPAAVLEAATGRPLQLIAGSGFTVPAAARGEDLALLSTKGALMLLRRGEGSSVAP